MWFQFFPLKHTCTAYSMILILHVHTPLVESLPASPSHVSYECMLRLEDNLTANRMALESVSSFKRSISLRHRSIASMPHEDNQLGDLMDPHGYVDNVSIHSSNSNDADPTSVSTVTCDWNGISSI